MSDDDEGMELPRRRRGRRPRKARTLRDLRDRDRDNEEDVEDGEEDERRERRRLLGDGRRRGRRRRREAEEDEDQADEEDDEDKRARRRRLRALRRRRQAEEEEEEEEEDEEDEDEAAEARATARARKRAARLARMRRRDLERGDADEDEEEDEEEAEEEAADEEDKDAEEGEEEDGDDDEDHDGKQPDAELGEEDDEERRRKRREEGRRGRQRSAAARRAWQRRLDETDPYRWFKRWIKLMSTLVFMFGALIMEALCLFEAMCFIGGDPSVYPQASNSIVPITACLLFLVPLGFWAANSEERGPLCCHMSCLVIYGAALLTLSVLSFVYAQPALAKDWAVEQWEQMSPNEQQQLFDADVDNLATSITYNSNVLGGLAITQVVLLLSTCCGSFWYMLQLPRSGDCIPL